jgi:hypothetical protein
MAMRMRRSPRAGLRTRLARRQRDRLDMVLDFLWLRAARWYLRELAATVRPLFRRRAPAAALAVGMAGAAVVAGRAVVHSRAGHGSPG